MAHSKVSTVANGPNKPLLSAGAWEQMGLVKFKINSLECINVEESMAEHPLSKETVLSTYKGVFDGLGHIAKSLLVTDKTMKPVQHTPRHVPVTLRD